MPSWHRSAAYRIAFGYSAAFALSIALLGVAIYFAMHAAFVRQLDQTVSEEANVLASDYDRREPGELADAISQREALRGPHQLYYAVYSAGGRRIFGSLVSSRPPSGLHDITFSDERGAADTGRAFAIQLADGSRLVVVGDLNSVEHADRTVITIFSLGFLVVVAFGVVGGLLQGSYLRRRLRAIQVSAEAISAGDISRRIGVSGRGDEFDQLAITLNAMLERIGGLLENLRQVSSDLAHDLRSPLARLRNGLESGLTSLPEEKAARAVLRSAIERVDEILGLFAAILRISEVESGKIRSHFESVDLSALAREIAESYAPAVAETDRKLTWAIEDQVGVLGDVELIAQALVNLLENALVHTPDGSSVQLSLARSETKAILSVEDNGPGLTPGDRRRITERFVRLDASRHRPGHGLGLNLVAAVARLHDAELIFEDARPGLRVDMAFRALTEPHAPP